MRRLTLTIFTALALVGVVSLTGLGSAPLSAQEQGAKIVFVDTQAAIRAHPAGQRAEELRAQARQEVADLRTSLEELAQKARGGQQLSAEESERYQTLLTTLQAVEQRYQVDIAEAATPAVEAVNEVIRNLAQEQGYTLVMDVGVAGNAGTGLVVYAQDGLDITPQVVEAVNAQFGGQ